MIMLIMMWSYGGDGNIGGSADINDDDDNNNNNQNHDDGNTSLKISCKNEIFVRSSEHMTPEYKLFVRCFEMQAISFDVYTDMCNAHSIIYTIPSENSYHCRR